MSNFIIFLFLLALGYFIGSFREKMHFKSIKEREDKLRDIKIDNLKKYYGEENIIERKLVNGSCVVAMDYFKLVLANLINITGGRVISYEALIDRGRREALIRMKEEAEGFDFVINSRIETSSIGKNANNKSALGAIEVLAYGTAIKIEKKEEILDEIH